LNTATLVVERKKVWAGSMLTIYVFVNGVEVGSLRNGEIGQYTIQTGYTTVLVKGRGIYGGKSTSVIIPDVELKEHIHVESTMDEKVGLMLQIVDRRSTHVQNTLTPSGLSIEDEIRRLAKMREDGLIDDEEFKALKKKLIN
jgi:hypothetical protein